MLSLVHLKGKDLLPLDWELLNRALATDYTGETLDHLALDLDRQTSQLWLVTGLTARLLIVTEVAIFPAGRELHVRYIAGMGWFRHFPDVLSLLEGLAANFGCRFITGTIRGEHALKYYRRFGGRPYGVVVSKDLWNGQVSENHSADRTESLRSSGPWAGAYIGQAH